MKLRFSPSKAAIGYIALGVLALALFAIPLWYGFQANLGTFRAYVPGAEMQRLVDIFHRDGAQAVAAAIDSYMPSMPSDEVMIFADPQKRRLAGNLPAWPAEVPEVPGTYGLVIGLGGDASMRVVTSHVTLPGGYQLLMGRESVRFQSLVERFWYGIAAAMASVLALGAAFAWLLRRSLLAEVNDISRSASAIVKGDLSRRLPARGGSGELDTLAHTVNGMLGQLEQRYALVMNASDEGFWDWNMVTDEFYTSPRLLEILGFPAGTRFAGRKDFRARFPFHPEDRAKWRQAVDAHFAGKTARLALEARLLLGCEVRWIYLIGLATRDATGAVVRWIGATTDITERKRAEALLAGERRVLELIAKGDAQGAVLGAICRAFDDLMPSLRSSVTLLDARGERVRLAAAPNLPAAFVQRMADLPLAGTDSGLCGLALRRAEPVFARDLAADPAWASFHELYATHGLAACWSVPFMSGAGKPLGTFAVFSPQPRDPTAHELEVLERFGHLASIAIEHTRAEETLRLSEERYALAMQASGEGHWDWKIASDEFYASPRWREISGFGPEESLGTRAEMLARYPFHPEDRPKYEAAVAAHFAGATPRLVMELRITPRGSPRWVRFTGMCLRDAAGAPVRWAGSIMDITEQKRAEEALRKSEQRYERAMEGSDAGHWDWNIVTDEMFVSERAREMLALPAGTLPARRHDVMALVPEHPDDRTAMHDQVRASIDSGSHQREYRVIPRPGEVRWLRSRGKVYKDARGAAVRMTGSLVDITERKLAADALRASEERYSLAMEASEEGHFDWNVRTDEIFVSAHIKKVFGLSLDAQFHKRKDLIARIPYHPDDAAWLETMARDTLAGQALRHEFEYRVLRDGQVRWLHAHWKILRDAAGQALRVIGVVTDVTERKHGANALKRSEERFALAVAGSNDGLWDWDILTNEMFLSERAQRIYGLEPGHTTRPRAEWRSLVKIHPDDAEGQLRNVEDYLAGKSANYEGEWRALHPDGRYRWIRIRGTCVRDAEGRPTRFAGSVSDIDVRRRAEEALLRSESYLTEALRLGRAGSFAYDARAHQQVHWSPTTYEIFDFDPAAGLPAPEEVYRRVHPEDVERVREARGKALSGKADYDAHYRIVRRDGTIRHLHATGHPALDANGEVVELVGVVTDVTERKRAEQELRDSEQRFRALTELSSDWYWRQDETLRFTYVSHQVADSGKYPREWVIGKARWELPGVTPLSAGWDEHQALLAARQPFREFEYARLGRGGQPEYVSVSGAPIFDEQGVFRGYQGVGRSITERKRAEEELRSRQEMLELAQKSARAIAFEWRIGADGPDRNRWSPELAAMYGLGPEAYDGSFEQWKKLVHPEDWPAVTQAIKHAQRTGEVSTEYRVVHPDASVHWLHARGRMFFDAAGTPVRMVGFMHDVTQRRHAEEELKVMERKLRQAQRLEAMGTLAGGIAHDFNNILGAILGYGEMAMRDAPKGSRLARDLDSIVTAGERGRALVDRVLAFSRSGVGERVSVPVEKVVREALDLVSAKLPPDVTLHAKLHAGRAAMLGDATQVHQVLMNLASNAVQAMPAGGTLRVSLGTLRVETPRAPTIGIVDNGDYLVLEVADTGTGILPDILDRIFDPFFTTKEVGTGTGLGLSLVHGIVAEVGGAINVASTPGVGSAFTVYLPRSGDALDSFQREEPELPRGDGQRVLVVDDEEPLVKLATRTLEELGYAPVGFTSSSAALAAFRADPQRFDAVITDERMPGMSGSALIREVRGIRNRIPVVLMSGFVGGAVASNAREAGAEEVLKKPLSARDLAASLARVLHS